MKNFEYVRPATIADAIAAAAEPGAAYLAGGTNLLDLMKGGISASRPCWSMSRACRGSTASSVCPMAASGSARWFAMPISRNDPDFASSYPAIAEALLSGASAQLRNAATVGGNLLAADAMRLFLRYRQRLQQARAGRRAAMPAAARTACTPCSAGAKPASPPIRRISACRWSRSTRSSRSRAAAGRREVPLEALHRLPGDTPEQESVLEPGDLDRRAAAAERSARGFAAHARYLKVRERTSYRLRRGVGRRRAADRTGHDLGRAAGAGRRRRQTMAGPRRREDAGKAACPAPRCSAAPRRPHSPMRSLPATTASRSNWRGGSWCAP